ncbi:hypothetical protein D3C86_1435050 [compost metagenome]
MTEPEQAPIGRGLELGAGERIHGQRCGRDGVSGLVEQDFPDKAQGLEHAVGRLGHGIAEATVRSLGRGGVVRDGEMGLDGGKLASGHDEDSKKDGPPAYQAESGGGRGGHGLAPKCRLLSVVSFFSKVNSTV